MESANCLSFSVLSDYLRCGREIEFSYQGKQYSVTNSQGEWKFCCDTDGSLTERICAFEDKDALIAYMQTHKIAGIPISDLFDRALYDADSVCIL